MELRSCRAAALLKGAWLGASAGELQRQVITCCLCLNDTIVFVSPCRPSYGRWAGQLYPRASAPGKKFAVYCIISGTPLFAYLNAAQRLSLPIYSTCRVRQPQSWSQHCQCRSISFRFRCRFSAQYREYKYFIVDDGTLDIQAIRAAAAQLEGAHDFRNFCKQDIPNVTNFQRKILYFRIEEEGTGCDGRRVYALRVRGTAFLWHQVRCMAAVLMMVGRGVLRRRIVLLCLIAV